MGREFARAGHPHDARVVVMPVIETPVPQLFYEHRAGPVQWPDIASLRGFQSRQSLLPSS